MTRNLPPSSDLNNRPVLLITIDTEGDNLWARPKHITTENARYLPRFQQLCEKYGFKTVWLTNYEMAECPAYVEFGREILANRTGEIGMHLHAWNSPPIVPLTKDDTLQQPYLGEYPEKVMRDKIRFITDLLQDRFQCRMISHRAGRWGLDSTYARLLVESGYKIDCSVTPHISWENCLGASDKIGGPNFKGFPEMPYFIDINKINTPGNSDLFEIPVSIIETQYAALNNRVKSISRLLHCITHRLFPSVLQMIPRDKIRNLGQMHTILQNALQDGRSYVQLAMHSSELMPGASPFFPNVDSIERLYSRLEVLFAQAAGSFRGATLKEFREEYAPTPNETTITEELCKS
jgi:hypothetical protein